VSESRLLVAVVDDDASVRESLPDLLEELGFAVCTFSSAEALLASGCIADTRCLIADIAMPGMTGFDLQHELQDQGHDIPTIFMTAQTDDALRRRLMESGAVAFLFKPFSEEALLEAIEAALGQR
jgi:FixJ family two-component response regulator